MTRPPPESTLTDTHFPYTDPFLSLNPVVIAQRNPTSCEVSNFIGCRRHKARRAQADVTHFDDLRHRPDQYIGVPDRRHAVFGHSFDADLHRTRFEVDRR